MYTKEDIEKAKQYLDNEGYGTGSNFTLNTVANLMAEYAAKNCAIHDVRQRALTWWNTLRLTERVVEMNKYGIEPYRSSDTLTGIEIQAIYESTHVA